MTARIALRCSGVSPAVPPWGLDCADAVARLNSTVATAAEPASNVFVYFLETDLMGFLLVRDLVDNSPGTLQAELSSASWAHHSISADSRLPRFRNVAWPSRLRLLAPLQSVSDLSRHWFVECGDGKMRAPRSAVVNCTTTFAPPGLIWIKLA
jgi:hypothetical protein